MKQNTRGLLLVIFLSAGFVNLAYAEKVYTPAQLRSMVKKGKYPQQGKPAMQSERMDYATCIAKVTALVNAVGTEYPTSTVLNTNIGRIEKVWTNDSAVTLTCSAPDRKLVITTAPYL